MPQLDVSTYPSQLLWLFVTFLTLYLILSTLVIPRISRFLVERSEAIGGKLREASLLRQEAEVLLNDYEKIMEDARVEARHHYMQVADRVAKRVSQEQKEMVEHVNETIRVAEQDLLHERAKLEKELAPDSLDVAKDILKKLAGLSYTKEELKKYQEGV